MSQRNDPVQEMVVLLQQSAKTRAAGERQQAIELAEKAIQVGEDAGVDITLAKVQKAILIDDQFELIAILEEGLARYVQEGSLVEQIDVLINLVGAEYHAGQYGKALQYLDQAEMLIGSLTPEQISKMDEQLPSASSLTAEVLLELRLAEIQRIRKVITSET